MTDETPNLVAQIAAKITTPGDLGAAALGCSAAMLLDQTLFLRSGLSMLDAGMIGFIGLFGVKKSAQAAIDSWRARQEALLEKTTRRLELNRKATSLAQAVRRNIEAIDSGRLEDDAYRWKLANHQLDTMSALWQDEIIPDEAYLHTLDEVSREVMDIMLARGQLAYSRHESLTASAEKVHRYEYPTTREQ